MPAPPPDMTPTEAAAALGVEPHLVYAWIRSGKLAAYRTTSATGGELRGWVVDGASVAAARAQLGGGAPKIGRPPKDALATRRNEVRSTPEDREHWDRCAESLGMEFGTWARRALNAASGRPVPDVGYGARRRGRREP